MRVEKHPILGDLPPAAKVSITVDGKVIEAREGEVIAAALTAASIRVFRKTSRHHKSRGFFCAIGRCTDCAMIVDGKPNVRTCVTRVRDGMVIQTQDGLGAWSF
jgi:predicted molibdopterin-dependent oxidoreductase YjgC